ncbi:MAG: hypothetical protein HYX60_02735 [Legionella longbeachae]|nr:hypothetical protein [Legionella longbeachae]
MYMHLFPFGNNKAKNEHEKDHNLRSIEAALDDIYQAQCSPWKWIEEISAPRFVPSRRTDNEKKLFRDKFYSKEPSSKNEKSQDERLLLRKSNTYKHYDFIRPHPENEQKIENRVDRRPIEIHEEKLEVFEEKYRVIENDLIVKTKRAFKTIQELGSYINDKNTRVSLSKYRSVTFSEIYYYSNSLINELIQALKYRQVTEITEAEKFERKLKKEINERNTLRLKKRKEIQLKIENCLKEKQLILEEFELDKACAKTYHTVIRPHNDRLAFNVFMKIYFSNLSLNNGDINKIWNHKKYSNKCADNLFSTLVSFLSLGYFVNESKVLSVLCAHKDLFNAILNSPLFVEVDLINSNQPKIIPLSTFSDEKQSQQYCKWFVRYQDASFNDLKFINMFQYFYKKEVEKHYIMKHFDPIKDLIDTKRIYSFLQLKNYARVNKKSLLSSLLIKNDFHNEKLINELKLLEAHEEKKVSTIIESRAYTNVIEESPEKYYKENLDKVDKIFKFEDKKTINYHPDQFDDIFIFDMKHNYEKKIRQDEKNIMGIYCHDNQYRFLDLTHVDIEESLYSHRSLKLNGDL